MLIQDIKRKRSAYTARGKPKLRLRGRHIIIVTA